MLALVGTWGDEAMAQAKAASITREEYRGWPETYRLANGQIEAAVVTAIGPRILELKAAGGRVAIASDNTRDPFYAYGDLDGFEVLREGARILHFDHPQDQAFC